MSDEPKKEEMSPQDLFWTTYLKDAEEEDKYLPKSWEANTGSVLTFVRQSSPLHTYFAYSEPSRPVCLLRQLRHSSSKVTSRFQLILGIKQYCSSPNSSLQQPTRRPAPRSPYLYRSRTMHHMPPLLRMHYGSQVCSSPLFARCYQRSYKNGPATISRTSPGAECSTNPCTPEYTIIFTSVWGSIDTV